MSSADTKKGAYGTVVKKKTGRWDMEEFEKRAKERAAREKELQEEDDARALGKAVKKKAAKEAPTEETIAIEKSQRLNLESAIGKSQVVQGGPSGRAPGFYCQLCDCVLKDSTAYMDHKNGKKHLKNLGVDRKAVREDLTDVVAKLQSMKRKAEEGPKKNIEYDLDARLEEAKRQEEREKAEKRERKKQKKNEKKADDDTAGFDNGGMDPAMAAMMGFSGFGSSK
ncbi:zinc finger, matrin-type 2 [Mortierella sp. AD032]|nr:zinc finger, matrin-type 2 [Mortierella sp. AD032]